MDARISINRPDRCKMQAVFWTARGKSKMIGSIVNTERGYYVNGVAAGRFETAEQAAEALAERSGKTK